MKALDLLITLRDEYIHGELDSDVNEAIKELEDLISENQTLKSENQDLLNTAIEAQKVIKNVLEGRK